jgi:hypothetical protein
MALATFRALVVDAADGRALGDFWAKALGRPLSPEGFIELPVSGMPPRRMWINTVPEPRTARNRARLELAVPDWDIEPLLGLGARLIADPPDQEPWLLVDPEGNEFHIVGADDGRTETELSRLTVDCRDGAVLAAWWVNVLGGKAGSSTYAPGSGWIGFGRSLPWGSWSFGRELGPKAVKNRWHWDVDLEPGIEPSALVELGATVLRPARGDQFWTIMADPEGNEFCAFPAD